MLNPSAQGTDLWFQAKSDLKLILPDLGLVNFPRDAAAFPELELIDLSDNQMQTIPNRINIFTVWDLVFYLD